jgi:hypothetical protein
MNVAIAGTASVAQAFTATTSVATPAVEPLTTTSVLTIGGTQVSSGALNLGTATSRSSNINIGTTASQSASVGIANGATNSGTVQIKNGTTNTGSVSIATGTGAGQTTSVSIGSGTTTGAITIGNTANTTTINSALTIGGSKNITLGDGTVAPTSLQLGYSIINRLTANQLLTGTSGTPTNVTALTITLPISGGVWLIAYNCIWTNPGGSTSYSVVRSYMTATNLASGQITQFGRQSTTANGITTTNTQNLCNSGSGVIICSGGASVINLVSDITFSTASGTTNIYGDSTTPLTYLSATRIA